VTTSPEPRDQVVEIAARATGFTVVCGRCAAADEGERGWGGSTFAGRLDLDLADGIFLCRRGHTVRVVRATSAVRSSATEAA
jgi:hypothetical protein